MLKSRVVERLKAHMTDLHTEMAAWRERSMRRGVFGERENTVRAGSMFLVEVLRRLDVQGATEKVRRGGGVLVAHWSCGAAGHQLLSRGPWVLVPKHQEANLMRLFPSAQMKHSAFVVARRNSSAMDGRAGAAKAAATRPAKATGIAGLFGAKPRKPGARGPGKGAGAVVSVAAARVVAGG